MARLIDADAITKNTIVDFVGENGGFISHGDVLWLISKQPTIEADPVKHGKWIDRMCRDWRCSECGGEICKFRHVDGYTRDDKPKYCPDCGARMDGE